MTQPVPCPSPEEAIIRRVRGSAFPMTTAAARVLVGPAAWKDLLDRLSPAARALAEDPPGMDVWLDPQLVAECWTRYRQAGGLGPVPGTLGAESFRARNPASFADPAALMAALPGFWASSVEGGRMEGEPTGPQSAEVRIWAVWRVPYFFETHAPAWFTHGTKLTGAHGAAVRYIPPATADGYLHTYQILWS